MPVRRRALPALAGCLGALLGCVGPAHATPVPLDLGPAPRVLVLAPHPDDETIGAGGLLARLAAAGTPAEVLFVTSGDGWPWAVEAAWGRRQPTPDDYLAFGKARMDEARQAAARLGQPAPALRFLGFPDGGIDRLWDDAWGGAAWFRSPTTAVDAVPYPGVVAPATPYVGATLAALLAQRLRAVQPTVVLLPHPYDTHADHAATARFGILAVRRLEAARVLRRRTRLLFYLVHHAIWPYPPPPGTNVQPPPAATDLADTRWRRLALTPEELGRKTAALEAHATQLAASPDFLRKFLRTDEPYGAVKSRVLAGIAAAHPAAR